MLGNVGSSSSLARALVAALTIVVLAITGPGATLRLPDAVTARAGEPPRATLSPDEESHIALREAEYYQKHGDYQMALARYLDAIGISADSPAGKDAYLGLARLQFQTGGYAAAVDALRDLLDRFPDDQRKPTATYMLAANMQANDRLPEAADYFRSYAGTGGVLAGYAYSQLGAIYLKLNRPAEAAMHLDKALDYDLPEALTKSTMDNLDSALAQLGNHPAAESWRQKLVSRALAGRDSVATPSGLSLDAIQDYSWTPSAERALRSVRSSSGAADDLDRGIGSLLNGRYVEAVEAFDRYLASKPDPSAASKALYYKGLSQRYEGQNEAAVATLLEMLASGADSDLAGEAMWQLGWLKELLAQHEAAAEWYRRSAQEYPGSEVAEDAIFRRGLSYYRMDDLPSARAIWLEALRLRPSSRFAPRVQFWLGKLLLEIGDADLAGDFLQAAAASQAWDYYGIRAREYYESRVGSFSGEHVLDIGDLTRDIPAEQAAFEEWLAGWSGQPRHEFDGSYARLNDDEGFGRLQELVQVGLRREARNEIDELRGRHISDPFALYELLMFLRAHEFYRQSVLVAEDIVRLSPADDVQGIPRFLQKLIYPVPFAELIIAEGLKDRVDLLLLTALVRQESMFDQQAESPAMAKGLGQVLPATGRDIARALQMDEFDVDDLYKPFVSLSFGAYQFADHLRSFGENPFFALAAYNAGAGSVQNWLVANPRQDADLFVEDIRFLETRSYVRRVYFLYDMYRLIWAQKL